MIPSVLCLKTKFLDFQRLDRPTHELGQTEIQITQECHQVVIIKILTLIKRLESLGGKLPPSSMWYFMRKPIPLMPLTAMGIFNIKTRIGITTAEFSNTLYNPTHGLSAFVEG